MKPGDYDDFYSILHSQQWILPYYQGILKLQSAASIILFVLTARFVLYKAKVYCNVYRRALVYTILFPTLMNFFIGFIYTPYFILPYEIVWSYGFFTFRNSAGYCFLCCAACFFPYLLSLFYVGVIYFRAFVQSGRLKIPPKIEKIFFFLTAVTTLLGCCLFGWGLFFHQDEKQIQLFMAESRLAGLFSNFGGFVLSLADLNLGFVTLAVTAFIFSVISFVAVWTAIFLMTSTALKRKKHLSALTYHTQNTFLAVGVIHIWIYATFIFSPAAFVVVSLYFQPTELKRYPLAPMVVLFLQCLSPSYCILYLITFSGARQRLWRFILNKK